MTKEEVEEAKKWLNKLYMKADITDEYGDMEDMQPYEEAINMVTIALEQTRWIPVSERLPGFGQTVLVTSDGDLYFEENGLGWCGQATTIAYLTEEGWEMSDINYECQMNKITAWQPLPQPYKAEMESDG